MRNSLRTILVFNSNVQSKTAHVAAFPVNECAVIRCKMVMEPTVNGCCFVVIGTLRLFSYRHTWTSEGFFPGGVGGSRGFSQKFLQGGPKVVKFVFYPTKLKKQPFFANNFKIWGFDPLIPPSDSHVGTLRQFSYSEVRAVLSNAHRQKAKARVADPRPDQRAERRRVERRDLPLTESQAIASGRDAEAGKKKSRRVETAGRCGVCLCACGFHPVRLFVS